MNIYLVIFSNFNNDKQTLNQTLSRLVKYIFSVDGHDWRMQSHIKSVWNYLKLRDKIQFL